VGQGHTALAGRRRNAAPRRGQRQAYILAVFESEEKARAREQDPRRQEGLQAMQVTMADILAGPPVFTDLTVEDEWAG
jgi:hypothetical protein